jgi:hypothetical protein
MRSYQARRIPFGFALVLMLVLGAGANASGFDGDDVTVDRGRISAINLKHKEAFVAYQVAIARHLVDAGRIKLTYSFDKAATPPLAKGWAYETPMIDDPETLAKELMVLARDSRFKKFSDSFLTTYDPDHIFPGETPAEGNIVEDLAAAAVKVLAAEYETALKEAGRLYAYETFSAPRIQVLIAKSARVNKSMGGPLSEAERQMLVSAAEASYDELCAEAERLVIERNFSRAPIFKGITGMFAGTLGGGNVEELNLSGSLGLELYPNARRNLEWNSSAEIRYSTKKVKGSAEDRNPVDVRDFRSSLTWYPAWKPEEESLEEHLEFDRFFLGLQAQLRDDSVKEYRTRYVGAGGGLARKLNESTLLVASVMGIQSWNRRNVLRADPQSPETLISEETDFDAIGMTSLLNIRFLGHGLSLDLKLEGLKPDFDDDDFFLYGLAAFDVQVMEFSGGGAISLTTRGYLDYRDRPDPGKDRADYTLVFGLRFDLGS